MAAREPQPTLATFRKAEGKHQQWPGSVLLTEILAIRLSWCALKEIVEEGGGILNQEAHVTSGAARQPTR